MYGPARPPSHDHRWSRRPKGALAVALLTLGFAHWVWSHGIASPACRFCLPPMVSQTTTKKEARSCPRWVSLVGCAASGPAGHGNPWGIAFPTPIECGRMGSHPQHVASTCRPWSRRPQKRLAPAHARWVSFVWCTASGPAGHGNPWGIAFPACCLRSRMPHGCAALA